MKMKRLFIATLILVILVPALKSQVRIKMQNEGGVYSTPCIVNGLKLRFIFDTGASNVSLSLSEAVFMLKNGYLEESDLHGSSFSQIANGDIVENTTVNLKEIEIAGIKINNVEATIIHELSAPLLLGQSAIKKLGKIQLEGGELIIMESNILPIENQCDKASSLIIEAEKYYLDNLDALATDTYQKAYDLCPSAFNCYDIYSMGNSFFYRGDYENAIIFFKKSNECKPDNSMDFIIFSKSGSSYMRLENYQEAELNYEKALSKVSDDNDRYMIHFDLGYLFSQMGEYQKGIDYYFKSLDFYNNYNKIDLEEAIRKRIKNEDIGIILYNIGVNYIKLIQTSNADRYMFSAKNFGHVGAADYCRTYNINFELNNNSF